MLREFRTSSQARPCLNGNQATARCDRGAHRSIQHACRTSAHPPKAKQGDPRPFVPLQASHLPSNVYALTTSPLLTSLPVFLILANTSS